MIHAKPHRSTESSAKEPAGEDCAGFGEGNERLPGEWAERSRFFCCLAFLFAEISREPALFGGVFVSFLIVFFGG